MPQSAYEQGKATADSYIQGIIDSMAGYDSIITGSFNKSLNSQTSASSASGGTFYSGDTVIKIALDSATVVDKTINELAQMARRGLNPLNM